MNQRRILATGLALGSILASAAARAESDCSSGDGGGPGGAVKRLRVVGLTDDSRLICFNDRAPADAEEIGFVSGLGGADSALIGIDFRVQDGLLYGVGNGGGVYLLDTDTAAATLVSQLTQALSGNSFGVDFNPAADRLRIVSDTGQNLRHNVNAGGVTVVDLTLNYTPGTPALGVTGAAYTNNDLHADTATTLFDVDSSLNQVVLQSPPNNGSLAAVGKLGVDPDAPVGFDVYSALGLGGATFVNRAFASLVTGGVSAFYTVELLTGKAYPMGAFTDAVVVDVAVPLQQ